VPRDHCPAIEAETGVRCEELLPDVVWTRDATGQVTGYHVPLQKAS
jgi:DNA-binding transcriptional regulator YdaS (Cro superfamily)